MCLHGNVISSTYINLLEVVNVSMSVIYLSISNTARTNSKYFQCAIGLYISITLVLGHKKAAVVDFQGGGAVSCSRVQRKKSFSPNKLM